MGAIKLDSYLIRSLIMAAPPDYFKVWIVLLVICDEDGIAWIGKEDLARICRLPLEQVEQALAYLETEDHDPRLNDEDRRQIKKVCGGYRIENYEKFQIKNTEKVNKRKQKSNKSLTKYKQIQKQTEKKDA